jgi:hypothetical protein
MSEISPSQTISAVPEPSVEHSDPTTTVEAAAPQPGPSPPLPEPTPNLEPTPTPNEPSSVEADIQDEEPQNLLTEKFTEAEWKALKEFRVSWSRLVPFI